MHYSMTGKHCATVELSVQVCHDIVLSTLADAFKFHSFEGQGPDYFCGDFPCYLLSYRCSGVHLSSVSYIQFVKADCNWLAV